MNRPEYSLTLDSVICRRCNAVSRAEEETCPSCGSDRQGAIFTTRSDPVAPIASAAPAAAAAAPMPGQLDITDLRDTGWLTRLVRRRMVTSYPSLAEPGDLPPEAERKPARKGLAVLIGGVVAGLAAGGYLYVQSDVGVVTANRPVISAAGSIGNGASAARGAGDEKRAGLDQSRAVAEQARTLASADDDAKRVRADDAQRLASRANSADAGSRRAPDASSAGGSVAITGVTAGASATPSGNRPMATAMADRRATNAGLGNSTVAKPAMGTEPKSAALALASTGQAPQSATTPVVKTASIADAGVSTGAVVSQSKPSAGGGTVSAQTPAASALGASQNKALASNAAGACDAGASTVKPASPGNATMASGSSNKAPANDAIGTREAVAAGTDGKKNVNAAQPAAPSLAAHSAPGAVASPATQTAANSKPENGSTSSKPATQTVAGGATSADASRGNAAASNGIASTTAKPVMQTAAASANTPDTSRSNATTLATSETTASGKAGNADRSRRCHRSGYVAKQRDDIGSFKDRIAKREAGCADRGRQRARSLPTQPGSRKRSASRPDPSRIDTNRRDRHRAGRFPQPRDHVGCERIPRSITENSIDRRQTRRHPSAARITRRGPQHRRRPAGARQSRPGCRPPQPARPRFEPIAQPGSSTTRSRCHPSGTRPRQRRGKRPLVPVEQGPVLRGPQCPARRGARPAQRANASSPAPRDGRAIRSEHRLLQSRRGHPGARGARDDLRRPLERGIAPRARDEPRGRPFQRDALRLGRADGGEGSRRRALSNGGDNRSQAPAAC